MLHKTSPEPQGEEQFPTIGRLAIEPHHYISDTYSKYSVLAKKASQGVGDDRFKIQLKCSDALQGKEYKKLMELISVVAHSKSRDKVLFIILSWS